MGHGPFYGCVAGWPTGRRPAMRGARVPLKGKGSQAVGTWQSQTTVVYTYAPAPAAVVVKLRYQVGVYDPPFGKAYGLRKQVRTGMMTIDR